MNFILGLLIFTLLVLAGFGYARVSRRRAEVYMRMLKREMEKF